MTHAQNLPAQPINTTSLLKRMLLGAGIALALISLFLFQVKNPNPAWPTYWMVKPLIMVPLAGAAGGAFTYFLDNLRSKGGWKTAAAILSSIIGFIFALWIGTVLGLNGTLWN